MFFSDYPLYGWFVNTWVKVASIYQSLTFNFDKACSWGIETNDSMIIQNNIKNHDFV